MALKYHDLVKARVNGLRCVPVTLAFWFYYKIYCRLRRGNTPTSKMEETFRSLSKWLNTILLSSLENTLLFLRLSTSFCKNFLPIEQKLNEFHAIGWEVKAPKVSMFLWAMIPNLFYISKI